MLSTYDAWLLPPESKIPELDDEDRQRILLDILATHFRRNAIANSCEHTVARWLRDEILGHGDIFDQLAAYHREKIEEAWVEEHQP